MGLYQRITLLSVLIIFVSCVPKDRLDKAEAKYQRLERVYRQTKDRADTLEWYANKILPVLTLRESPDVQAQVLPDIIRLNNQMIEDREWGDISPGNPREQEMAALLTRDIAYLTDEGIQPVTAQDVEGRLDLASIQASLDLGNAIAFTPLKDSMRYSMTLDRDLLFDKGEYEIKASANRFLQDLASRLKLLEGYWIIVEGHTDNLEYYEQEDVSSSWELSVLRAARMVEHLDAYGVPPENMIASGKGQFHSTFINTREENRRLNRRIEIILSPKDKN